MKYLYCDSCFLITSYQEKYLELLAQYKNQFFISNLQIKDELIKPKELADKVRKCLTVIEENEEIIAKANELLEINKALSFYDCLCLAFCIIDGYCLITDDKHLIKKSNDYNVQTKQTNEIIDEFHLKKENN